jgi:hypothetical protein
LWLKKNYGQFNQQRYMYNVLNQKKYFNLANYVYCNAVKSKAYINIYIWKKKNR